MRYMRLLQPRTTVLRPKNLRSIFTICVFAFVLSCFTPQANAGFIGYYALSNFTLTNTCTAGVDPCPPPDGLATTSNNGLTALLVGGNNGSGLSGVTDLTIAAAAAGTVQFDFSYASFDFPGADYAGYLTGGVFHKLADIDGQASSVSFAVNAGELFGFRVGTADNTSEPGILTVMNFSAPEGAAVPEPASVLMMAAGVAALVVGRRYVRGTRKGNA